MSLLSILAADPAETHHWLLPETAEIIYGGIASVLVIGALVKFAGPQFTKFLNARTERIQKELDASASDLATAQTDERARLLADANTQAAAVLTDGRARLTVEIAELEARASADIETAAARGSDELRAEIGRVASIAVDAVLPSVLDGATQQSLVENFISKVGASR